jgi:hypothetical protein
MTDLATTASWGTLQTQARVGVTRRVDQFSPHRTETVVATPSCCCCCCCCCCAGTLSFGGVLTEKLLTSTVLKNNPELTPPQAIEKYRVQRVLAGFLPAVFLGAAITTFAVLRQSGVNPAWTWAWLPVWIGAHLALFYSAKAWRAEVAIPIVATPFAFLIEFGLGFVTLGIAALVTSITGVTLAAIKGSKRPGETLPTYFVPQGPLPPGYYLPPGQFPPGQFPPGQFPPAYYPSPDQFAPGPSQPLPYDGTLHWTTPPVDPQPEE